MLDILSYYLQFAGRGYSYYPENPSEDRIWSQYIAPPDPKSKSGEKLTF